VLDDLI